MLDTVDEIFYKEDSNKIYLTMDMNIIEYEKEKKIMKILLYAHYPYAKIDKKSINKIDKIIPNIDIDLDALYNSCPFIKN